jgi:hypothetical protein
MVRLIIALKASIQLANKVNLIFCVIESWLLTRVQNLFTNDWPRRLNRNYFHESVVKYLIKLALAFVVNFIATNK